jgi:hypothetical protein
MGAEERDVRCRFDADSNKASWLKGALCDLDGDGMEATGVVVVGALCALDSALTEEADSWRRKELAGDAAGDRTDTAGEGVTSRDAAAGDRTDTDGEGVSSRDAAGGDRTDTDGEGVFGRDALLEARREGTATL